MLDGLIIKKHWLDLILSGEKTWEIRGSNTKKRGQIALIQSGTSMVFGICEIVDSKPVTLEGMQENKDKHHIESVTAYHHLKYDYPHAWVFKNAKRIEPTPYKHPQGAVIWVKDVVEFERTER